LPSQVTPESVRHCVTEALRSYAASEQSSLDHGDETVLLGERGVVDSLGLVRLILTVERRLEDDLGIQLSLTDEKAMSERNSPFRTVGALISYVQARLQPVP
jgi:D-alanine--poly(phosphoribitol) ligase subunit 2